MVNVKRTWNLKNVQQLKQPWDASCSKGDNAIHQIDLYLVDDAIGFPNTYLMYSELSRRR